MAVVGPRVPGPQRHGGYLLGSRDAPRIAMMRVKGLSIFPPASTASVLYQPDPYPHRTKN
jgi:hypothetical protein